MGVIKTFQKTPQREQEPEQPKVFHFTPTSHEIPGKTFILETKREPDPPRLLKVTLREN